MRSIIVYKPWLLPISETFIKDQVLACTGWNVLLVGRERVSGLPLDGLRVLLLEPERPSIATRALARLRQYVPVPYFAALRQLRKFKPELVHVHFGTNAVEAARIANALSIPMLVTLHGYDINVYRHWWESGHGGRRMRKYPSALLKLAQRPDVHFIAVSEAIRERAVEFGIPASKLTVLYIGTNVTQFGLGHTSVSRRQHNVLFVGRLVEKKGCALLLRAVSEVLPKVPDVTVTIAGDGPLRADLETLAVKLRVPATFLGSQPPHEIQRLLGLARVFCLPSMRAPNGDDEGLPIVLLEAQAAGVPVVTSATGGAREGILDGITGYRFEPGNCAQLADRLFKVLSDDSLAQSMSAQARPFVEAKFNIEACTARLTRLYLDVIAK